MQRRAATKFTRWRNDATYNQALQATFQHFDETRSFAPIATDLASVPEGKYPVEDKFIAGNVYGLGIPESAIPEKIKRLGRRDRLAYITEHRVKVNDFINNVLFTIPLSSKRFNINDKKKVLDGITSPAAKNLISFKNMDLDILIGISKDLPRNLEERIQVNKERARDLYVNSVTGTSPAHTMRNAIVTSWIKEKRDLASKSWNVFDNDMINDVNIQDAQTRKFFEEFIDQDVHSIVGKLSMMPTLDSWNAKIARKLADLNKRGQSWAKKDFIDFWDKKIGQEIKVDRKIIHANPSTFSLDISFDKKYMKQLFDSLLNKNDDIDIVDAMMQSIYIDRDVKEKAGGKSKLPLSNHAPYKQVGTSKTWDARLPYSLDEFKQHLFHTDKEGNGNGELHEKILKQWYMEGTTGIKFACDALTWLREKEWEKPTREEMVAALKKQGIRVGKADPLPPGIDVQDPRFLVKARFALARMKRNRKCH